MKIDLTPQQQVYLNILRSLDEYVEHLNLKAKGKYSIEYLIKPIAPVLMSNSMVAELKFIFINTNSVVEIKYSYLSPDVLALDKVNRTANPTYTSKDFAYTAIDLTPILNQIAVYINTQAELLQIPCVILLFHKHLYFLTPKD